MIATLNVLGLRARDVGTIVTAARRVAAYVQGTLSTQDGGGRRGLAGYYGATDGVSRPVQGRAWGAAAGLVGLSGVVSAGQLEQLLSGRHALTGTVLLPASGSAGRVAHPRSPMPAGDAALTLAEAARVAGVRPGYLRMLAEQQPATKDRTGAEPPPAAEPAAGDPPSGRPTGRPERDWLRAEREPETGRWLVGRAELARFMAEREPPTVVLGFDLTCSAPKAVSLLWAFGDEALRADVAAAVDAGVGAALSYLQRHAAVGTVGGRNRAGLGLAVASYRHEVSRADEAHLHVHNIIVNAVPVPVLEEDGRPVTDERGIAQVVWRAVDSEVLHRHVKTAGYVGAAALRRELSLRRGLRWAPVRNGVAELAAFPRGLLDAFSTRRGQIAEEFTQLVDAGLAPDAATRAAAQRRTRTAKRVLADAEVTAIQHRRLTEAGWTADRVRSLARPAARQITPPTEDEIAALFDHLAGPHGVTADRPDFTLREATQAVAAWAVDRLDPDGIQTLAEPFLADPRAVLLSTAGPRRRSRPDPAYTTVDLLDVERRLLGLYQTGRTPHGRDPQTPVPAELVADGIAAAQTALRQDTGDPNAALSGEQTRLVGRLLTGRDMVRLVVGPAGTGKTEALRAVTHALTAAGRAVVGAANGGRQAEDLRARLDIPTRVVAAWLTLLDHTPDPADIWPPGTVLVLDEATQVSTRDAERLLTYAAATGTVTILVGDPAQLGSVGAGGWFTHLTAGQPAALTQAQRQRGPALDRVRRALDALRSPAAGQAAAALDDLAADGRLRTLADRDELLAAVVTDWYTDRRAPGCGGPMLAERSADTDLLNTAARALLHADATLHGPVLRAAGRDFQAGDQVITLTQQGHTLIPAGGPATAYIRTGSIGTITAVHPDTATLTVQFPGKGTVTIGLTYLTHAFPDGRDGGLAHAYAITAHKAEGATLDVARALAVDDTSRPGLYVMLSRARRDLRAYIVARPDLTTDPTDETWLPILRDHRTPQDRLADHLDTHQPEQLATNHDPTAATTHRLRTERTLADLTRLHRRTDTGIHPHLIAKAEHAAEATVAATAPHHPPAALLARIGPRPGHGPDRVIWDAATTALATYHARWQPTCPPHQTGPEPNGEPDDAAQRWQRLRELADQIATAWADTLPADQRRAFHTAEQAIPRDRATAGIHALLDHGHTPTEITEELTRREHHTARTPAAVLDHRVHTLLNAAGIDPTAYQQPPPRTRRQDWQHTTGLLQAAATAHLADRPTAHLTAEHHHLTQLLTGGHQADLTTRLDLLHAALARQLDHAALCLTAQPPAYLTNLLGPRPTDPTAASTWDTRSIAIEHYRHYALGLPHGTPAAGPTAPPAHQALGPPPADPASRHRYDQLRALQTTLDLGAGL